MMKINHFQWRDFFINRHNQAKKLMNKTAIPILTLICISVIASNCTDKLSGKPVRNLTINKSNSYSSLFMDSVTVESFIKEQKLNDSISHDMRVFYNARNFQFAWFSGDGLTEQAFIFRSLYDYSKKDDEKRPLDYKLDNLMLNDSIQSLRANRNITKTELLFTWRFIVYLWNEHSGEKRRNNMLVNFVPGQKQEIMKRAETVLDDDGNGSNESYRSLKKELRKYVKIARNGGWPEIPERRTKYRIGKTNTAITTIKKRLQITGDFAVKDTSPVYTPELEKVIKKLQNSYGLTADGVIDAVLIRELNKPVLSRLQQMMINMERMRWQPAEPKGRRINVNIPEFMLHVWDGNTREMEMEVIVGKQGNSTIMFSGYMDQVVFSPYWNVPESIVRDEILPEIGEDSVAYLQQHNMEITGEVDSVPVIRQLPGEGNALGKVKFLFPNSFNIYFHDTPDKGLFKKKQRAYSHGCIRLADAEKLANYLLKDEWTPEKIKMAMNSGKEKFVKIEDPIPVFIEYYTAWVDEDGVLQFRKDIYGHDRKMLRKLFL
jgi:murein L,D-transpeptidase YcbB/YkuD